MSQESIAHSTSSPSNRRTGSHTPTEMRSPTGMRSPTSRLMHTMSGIRQRLGLQPMQGSLNEITMVQPSSTWYSLEDQHSDHNEASDVAAEKHQETVPRFIIHPQNRFRVTWDLIALAFLLYFVFQVPFRLSFLDTQTHDKDTCQAQIGPLDCEDLKGCAYDFAELKCDSEPRDWVLFTVDTSIDVFFLADVFLNFRTAYYVMDVKSGNQRLVVNSNKIAWHYLTGFFIIDLAGSIPMDAILLLADTLAESGAASDNEVLARLPKLLRVGKAVRLLKLVRAARIGKILNRLQEFANISPSTLKVLTYAFIFALVAHLLSCTLFALGTMTGRFRCLTLSGNICDDDSTINVGATWLTKNTIILRQRGDVPTGPIQIIAAPLDTQYVMSVYWAITIMTTVGFGDLKPTTMFEVYSCILCMLVGASTFSYVVGNLAALIGADDGQSGAYRQKMDLTTVFMHDNNVPKDLKLRIRKYYDYHFNSPQIDLQKTVLCDLSPSLTSEFIRFFRRNILASISIFKPIDERDRDRFLGHLTEKLVPYQLGPGDYVFYNGELGQDILFIINGEVDVIEPETNEIVATFKRGNFVGENALLIGEERRAFSVRARTWCDLLSLRSTDLQVVLQDFPRAEVIIREVAAVRWNRLIKTIDAHKVVSRARARASMVTGKNVFDLMSTYKLAERTNQSSNLNDTMDQEEEENDRKLTREEAELLGDLRATVMNNEVGQQMARMMKSVEDRIWDWSSDWVDNEDIPREGDRRQRKNSGAGLNNVEHVMMKRQQAKGRSHNMVDLDGEDQAAPGQELAEVLHKICLKLDQMEESTDVQELNTNLSKMNVSISRLSADSMGVNSIDMSSTSPGGHNIDSPFTLRTPAPVRLPSDVSMGSTWSRSNSEASFWTGPGTGKDEPGEGLYFDNTDGIAREPSFADSQNLNGSVESITDSVREQESRPSIVSSVSSLDDLPDVIALSKEGAASQHI